MKSVCVYCGSSDSTSSRFRELAYSLGKYLAENSIRLIYGGAQVGLMGKVADGCLENGGEVYGVIPTFLAGKEIAHHGLTKIIRVDSMHERKMEMFNLSEGFIALPGGFGTLEELSEILTWQQLGLHKFPVGILNADNFYDPLKEFFLNMNSFKLLSDDHLNMALFDASIEPLLDKMRKYIAPPTPNFLNESET